MKRNYTSPLHLVVVAVIDDGVDGEHLDLNLTTNGYDFTGQGDPDPQPLPDDHHGTGIAGIIGAKTNNDNGVSGVAGGWSDQYETQIMPLRIGYNGIDSIVHAGLVDDAILYAAENGANIINMSFKVESNIEDVIRAIEYAYKEKGLLLVAASGNEGSPPVLFPANNEFVMAVGGISPTGGIGGSFGPELEVVAPSSNIYSTINSTPGDRYRWGFYDGGGGDGTSASAPMVAGISALIWSLDPDLIPFDIRRIIWQSAKDEGAPGFDDLYGYGLAKTDKAVDFLWLHIPPENLAIEVVGTHAQLTWDAATWEVDHYNVLSSSSNTGRYDFEYVGQVYHTGPGTYSWTDWSYHIFPGENQHTRYYRVTAVRSVNDTTESITSNEVSVGYGGAGGGELEKMAEDNNNELMFEYNLFNSYPNPFNPSANIEYSLKEGSFVELKVYDVIGRAIVTLVNEFKQPGKYSVNFDASRLPSGVYFYRIIAGSFTDNKKMVLTK